MDRDNHRICRDMEDTGCSNVLTVEDTCPRQFRCGDPPPGPCLTPTADCMNEEVYAHCRELEDSGCRMIAATRSCPPQFFCLRPTPEVCGHTTDSCMDEAAFDECTELADNGCEDVLADESCPRRFRCAPPGDPDPVDDTGELPMPGEATLTLDASTNTGEDTWQPDSRATPWPDTSDDGDQTRGQGVGTTAGPDTSDDANPQDPWLTSTTTMPGLSEDIGDDTSSAAAYFLKFSLITSITSLSTAV